MPIINDIQQSPVEAGTDSLLEQLLVLENSTVNLMEKVTGLKLQVLVESQTEEKALEKYFIKRIARLFFSSPERPSIYCITYLDKSVLSNAEYQQVIKGEQPIGRLFALLNDNVSIYKRNISVTIGQNQPIATILQSGNGFYHKKKYDYWIGRRKVGEVIECFNQESLVRI